MFIFIEKERQRSTGKEAGADPVKLRPSHRHAAVVVGVVAGAAEGLLSQEDQVLLGQASVTLHLGLVLHVDGITQLRPKHLIWHEERHPSLQTHGRQRRIYASFIVASKAAAERETQSWVK